MIQVNELRIGNYVTIDNLIHRAKESGKTHKVTEIRNKDVEVFEIGTNFYTDSYSQFKEYLKPIELTEEILLKCGFRKKQDYINGVGLCIFFEHKEFNYRLNQSFEVVLLKIKLNYLHQLQNLYFALTQKELEINL